MYVLVAIAHPDRNQINIVMADLLSPNIYQLREDSKVKGYKKGDIVEAYSQTSQGIPKVQKQAKNEAE